MESLGIRTGADLRDRSLAFLTEEFGSSGAYFHLAARGIDDRAVTPDRPHKSVGAETTFEHDLTNVQMVYAAMDQIIASLMRRVERSGACGRTVTLKVRYADFRQVTRSMTMPQAVSHADEISAAAKSLIGALPAIDPGIRLLGVTLSNLVGGSGIDPVQQQSLPFNERVMAGINY
jgi:DNA polymerase-4